MMNPSLPLPSAIVSALVLAAALVVPAHADECVNANTQTAMNICFDKIYRAADEQLNVGYQDVSSRLGGDSQARKSLVTAQKAWIAFRDSECEFESSASTGGSLHPMVVSQCLTALTRARTQALHRMLSCKEGDVACPLPPK